MENLFRGIQGLHDLGCLRLLSLLVVLLCLAAVVPVVCEQQLQACQIQTGTKRALCECNNGNDTQVICNSRNPKLTRVPAGLPADITVLDVSFNAIAIITKDDFLYLEQVRTLFLQQNQIATIEDGAFSNLYNLQLLVLYDNRLTSVPETLFQHLPSIKAIDLQRNNIQSVHKRAFLTLPASTQTNGVVVRISGNNNMHCDCNLRAIRDWKNSLSGNLTKVSFDGLNCVNAQGKGLDNMKDNEFPSCTSDQLAMFETNQKCTSCQGSPTQHGCVEAGTAGCGSAQPVCQSQIQYQINTMSITKTCTSYASCLELERANSRQCNVSHSSPISSMLCTFCCVGSYCNLDDAGGRTKSFRFFVTFQINITFQQYMINVTSDAYQQSAAMYEQQIRDRFVGAEGGYSMKFLYFRNESPYTRLTLEVYTTNFNTFNGNQVISLLVERLSFSANQGFLWQQRVIANSIYVGTELSFADQCPAEITNTSSGDILWRQATADSTSYVSCPVQPADGDGKPVYASRKCLKVNGIAQWDMPNLDACIPPEQSDTTRRLRELAGTEITSNNVDSVLNQLKQLVTDEKALTADDISLAMNTVDQVLKEGTALTQIRSTDAVTAVLSELIDADLEVLKMANTKNSSASRLLSAVDHVAREGPLTNGQMMSSARNIVLAAQAVDSDTFKGLTMTAYSQNDKAFQHGDVEILPNSTTLSGNVSGIALPPSLLTSASGASRIAMSVHRTDKVFEAIRQTGGTPTSDGSRDVKYVTKVNSHVMAASVVDYQVSNLQEPVIITLVHDSENSTNPQCVFWEDSAYGAKRGWSSRGCRLVQDQSTDTRTKCACDHLTNFALLMDVYGRGEDLSATDRKILSIISYIGCGVSLLALIFTLITYFMFKKLRRDNPSKILINLCLALALSNLVFLVGMQDYAFKTLAGCKTVAVLLHFFLLASLCWMAVEAFYMYLALVLVFKTYFTNFILKCSVVGWGVPLVIVIISLAVNDTDNYGPLNSGVCWLKGVPFYAAFVGPVCLILLLNFIAFALVLRTILGLAGRKLNKSDSFTTAQQLRGAIGVVILLGLTWVFGVLAIDQASVVFYYLFAIFNSLQGLFIFIFYCLLKKEARNSWRRFCCKHGDEKSSAVTTSKANYSGTAATHHAANRSTTDSSLNGHITTTTSTTITGSASSLRDINVDLSSKNSGADKDAHTYENLKTSTADQNTQPVKPAMKMTQLSTAARPIQFTPGHTIPMHRSPPSESPPSTSPPTSPTTTLSTDTTQDTAPSSSPRPLRFGLGHAHSVKKLAVGARDSTSDYESTTSPTTDDPPAMSVADRIKQLNTRL